jgi:hypothetical protein
MFLLTSFQCNSDMASDVEFDMLFAIPLNIFS